VKNYLFTIPTGILREKEGGAEAESGEGKEGRRRRTRKQKTPFTAGRDGPDESTRYKELLGRGREGWWKGSHSSITREKQTQEAASKRGGARSVSVADGTALLGVFVGLKEDGPASDGERREVRLESSSPLEMVGGGGLVGGRL